MWFGVDIQNESIANNYDAFVWEPALVKINYLQSAAEAACLILSVDETIRNPQSKQGDDDGMGAMGAMGGGGGRGRGRRLPSRRS